MRSRGAARSYDVVVVGARCAGAALAQRLAAAGVSVALLDAAKLPSDQPASTHLIQPPGMEELDALGLAEPVREAAPALHALRLSYDGNAARLAFGKGRAGYCLPREDLDGLLQQAAVDAGADLQPQTRVIDVLRRDDGALCGVTVRRAGAGSESIHADLIVGADGRNSTIAKLVGAEEYLGYDGPRFVYWAYWPAPAGWNMHEFQNSFDTTSARVVFPTTSDRLLIGTVPTIEHARSWRADHTAAYIADIRACELVAAALSDEQPIGEVRGVLSPRYFFRASAGPGWALIGDAGHHKEFVIGLGISDALHDARGLAAAVQDGGLDPGPIQAWWRRRDVERIELFEWSRDLGRAEPVNALQRLVPARIARSPQLDGRFGEVIAGRLSPYDLVPPSTAGRWVAAALLRGNIAVLPPVLDTARRRAQARRQRRRRRRIGARGTA